MRLIVYILSLIFSIVCYYRLSKIEYRNILLFVISLLFYTTFEGYRVGLLLFIIIATYLFASLLLTYKSKSLLCVSIIINILILLSYKYIPFIIDSPKFNYLPIGLSFYTFQSISYLTDVYKDRITEKYSFIEVGLYLSFFPKIMAGPLEKANVFILQLRELQIVNLTQIFTGLKIILLALCLKYVLADSLGVLVNNALTEYKTDSIYNILTTSFLFSFQIFYDFYAYSILAIGIALMYGIRLSHNFYYPYFCSSFRSFWKRWNMTLMLWLRDYIYIPIGGNRVGKKRWIFNVILVFIISGIWHNATLNFIIWGVMHSLFIIIEHHFNKSLHISTTSISKIIYTIFVFIVVSLLWLVFKIEDTELLYIILKQLSNFNYGNIMWKEVGAVAIMSCLFIIFKKSLIIEKYIFQTHHQICFLIKEVIFINIILLLLIFFSSSVNSSFIYFKF